MINHVEEVESRDREDVNLMDMVVVMDPLRTMLIVTQIYAHVSHSHIPCLVHNTYGHLPCMTHQHQCPCLSLTVTHI